MLERPEVRELHLLARDLHVALLAEALDRPLHGVDVEADPGGELDGGDEELGVRRLAVWRSRASFRRALTTFDWVSRSIMISI